MKVGDLVKCYMDGTEASMLTGIIVGFNKKGEGGKDFVHVLHGGIIHVLMCHNVVIVGE